MPKQDQDFTVLNNSIADKITPLVEDRDFLNWGEKKASSPAAPVIEKLIAKAADEDKDGNPNPLYEAGKELTARFGNDRQRKIVQIREALRVLAVRRDQAAAKSLTSGEHLASVTVLQPRSTRDASQPRVASPFLA